MNDQKHATYGYWPCLFEEPWGSWGESGAEQVAFANFVNRFKEKCAVLSFLNFKKILKSSTNH